MRKESRRYIERKGKEKKRDSCLEAPATSLHMYIYTHTHTHTNIHTLTHVVDNSVKASGRVRA
jgi:hypothetical protein